MRRLGVLALALAVYGILALVHSRTTLLSLCTPADWTDKVVLITGAAPAVHEAKTHATQAPVSALASSSPGLLLARAPRSSWYAFTRRQHSPSAPIQTARNGSELAAVRVRFYILKGFAPKPHTPCARANRPLARIPVR